MNDVAFETCDVLIVGGGAAGATAAIKAKEFGVDVLIVEKAFFGSGGCSALASGAYEVWLPSFDVAENIRGRGDLANQRLAIKAEHASYDVFNLLQEWGVEFVKENGEFWLRKSPSGGYGVGLVGGGPQMMKVVAREALKRGVRVVNRVMVIDLLTSDGRHPTAGRVVGAIGVDTRTGKIRAFQAKAVVMCAGGTSFPYPEIGQPFPGMPINLSGDGVAAELRAGAVMGNLAIGGMYYHAVEFFTAPGLEHFTRQGVKWVNRKDEEFMKKYEEAERQVTRRHALNVAMSMETREGRGPVSLDARHFTPDQFRFLKNVIPIILSNYQKAGYDLTKEPVPYFQTVAGVHGFNYSGGAVIDEFGRTSLEGLYAAGASSDGANIKLNMALRECFVTGLWAGEAAAKYAKTQTLPEVSGEQVSGEQVSGEQVNGLSNKIRAPLELHDGIGYAEAHNKLARISLDLGSVPVNTRRLTSALDALRDFSKHDKGRIMAENPHYLGKVHSLKNSAETFEVILMYMLHRKESRGSVLNEDYPHTDNIEWLKRTRSRIEGDGELRMWDDPVPDDNYVLWKASRKKFLHPIFEVLARESRPN